MAFLLIMSFIFFLSFFHFLLEFNSFIDNGVSFIPVHFSNVLIRLAINLIDKVFFDKLEVFFENMIKLLKVRSDIFFIFKHHLNNLRQFFLILSLVENVGKILLSGFKVLAIGCLSGEQLIKSQTKTVDIILERIWLNYTSQFFLIIHLFEKGRHVGETTGRMSNILNIGA